MILSPVYDNINCSNINLYYLYVFETQINNSTAIIQLACLKIRLKYERS